MVILLFLVIIIALISLIVVIYSTYQAGQPNLDPYFFLISGLIFFMVIAFSLIVLERRLKNIKNDINDLNLNTKRLSDEQDQIKRNLRNKK